MAWTVLPPPTEYSLNASVSTIGRVTSLRRVSLSSPASSSGAIDFDAAYRLAALQPLTTPRILAYSPKVTALLNGL